LKNNRKTIICLILIIATLAVYWQVQNNDFVYFDDDLYVLENPDIKTGLNLKSIYWAFTNVRAGFWFPITWLSHIIDYSLYGINPKGHHFNNLLFHTANALLLFLALHRMTGALWRSACVSALFALCPLNAEPVAWISSRKDVLSTFFWMLTIYCYTIYTEKPEVWRYLLVFLFFSLGLMSKPMLMTLPFVLILLDYWPLDRLRLGSSSSSNNLMKYPDRNVKDQKYSFMKLLFEKVPLFIFSLSSCVIVYFAEMEVGALKSLDKYPLDVRIFNAITSYAKYVYKLICPVNLACFYPHPGMPEWWQIAGSGFIIIMVSILALKYIRQHPYLFVGWLWYLVTLVPVIGFIQIGGHALADRYAYIPLIGIFIIIVWGGYSLFTKRRYNQIAISIIFCLFLLYSSIFTNIQIGYWQNSITLFKHAINVTPANYKAQYNLGIIYARMDNLKEATYHFYKALEIDPRSSDTHTNLGFIFFQKGDLKEAFNHYKKALEINPENDKAHNNLGVLFVKTGDFQEALFHFSEAVRINPGYINARNNLSLALQELGHM
jgi:tetratricopeptide (TPR) repeat protein